MSGFDELEKMAAELLRKKAAAVAREKAEAEKESDRVRGLVFAAADEIFKGLGLGDTPDERRSYELDGAVTYRAPAKEYRGVAYALEITVSPSGRNWHENALYFNGELSVGGKFDGDGIYNGDRFPISFQDMAAKHLTNWNPQDRYEYAYFPMRNTAADIAEHVKTNAPQWVELQTGVGLRLAEYDKFMHSRIDYLAKEQADEQARAEANKKAEAERARALTPSEQILTGLRRYIIEETGVMEPDDYDE